MITDYLKINECEEDEQFDKIYSDQMRKMSNRHFTEIAVAIKAAEFLATKPKQRILDIGSGLGKFCFVAGSHTEAEYTGVDYRKHFVEMSEKLTIKHKFRNVNFIHSDIIRVDFTEYDGFYFFNSFLEHWDSSSKLDDTIDVNYNSYKIYTEFLRTQFDKLPAATRIVTYYAETGQIPKSYNLLEMHFNGLLKCWEKRSDSPSKYESETSN